METKRIRDLPQANARRRAAAEHKTHKRLRLVGGALAGKRITSGRGETTRPMMEKVRGDNSELQCYILCCADSDDMTRAGENVKLAALKKCYQDTLLTGIL